MLNLVPLEEPGHIKVQMNTMRTSYAKSFTCSTGHIKVQMNMQVYILFNA